MTIVVIAAAACSSSPSSGDWRVVVDVQGKLPTEVAIGLGLSGPPGCETRVVRVEYRPDDRVVQPVVALPKGPCDAVAIPRAAIVAVPRAELPPVPFTVRIRFTRCEGGCLGAPLVVPSLGTP